MKLKLTITHLHPQDTLTGNEDRNSYHILLLVNGQEEIRRTVPFNSRALQGAMDECRAMVKQRCDGIGDIDALLTIEEK